MVTQLWISMGVVGERNQSHLYVRNEAEPLKVRAMGRRGRNKGSSERTIYGC